MLLKTPINSTSTYMSTQSAEHLLREPIMIIKSSIPTVNIIGYAWRQTESSIILHLKLENAIDVEQVKTRIQEKSLDITFMNHYGVDYNFRINQLYSTIIPDSIQFKSKGDKIIITLQKAIEGEEWLDLKTKSTHTIFNQLARNQEKQPEVVFLSPFLSPGNSPK